MKNKKEKRELTIPKIVLILIGLIILILLALFFLGFFNNEAQFKIEKKECENKTNIYGIGEGVKGGWHYYFDKPINATFCEPVEVEGIKFSREETTSFLKKEAEMINQELHGGNLSFEEYCNRRDGNYVIKGDNLTCTTPSLDYKHISDLKISWLDENCECTKIYSEFDKESYSCDGTGCDISIEEEYFCEEYKCEFDEIYYVEVER